MTDEEIRAMQQAQIDKQLGRTDLDETHYRYWLRQQDILRNGRDGQAGPGGALVRAIGRLLGGH